MLPVLAASAVHLQGKVGPEGRRRRLESRLGAAVEDRERRAERRVGGEGVALRPGPGGDGLATGVVTVTIMRLSGVIL
mgnify:CR=1 FL=1